MPSENLSGLEPQRNESPDSLLLAEIEDLFSQVPAGLCVVDRDLRFMRINGRLSEINGIAVTGHLGRTVREVLPDLADDLEPLFLSVLDTGEPVLQREIHGTTPARPGAVREWLASYYPLMVGGRVDAVSGIVIEMTEQKQAQESLRRSEERLRIALEGNSEGVWDWDVRKGPAVFNDGYSRMLGYEPEEFAKDYDTWRTLVHPEDIGRVDRAHAEHIYEGKKFRVELRMRKKNGDWCWILSRGAVVERDAEGRAVRMIGTHMDITEQKLAEAEKARLQEQLLQAQKLESVGRLAGGVAHDFNNLLTVINGYSDLLLRELGEDDPHREIITDIKTVGQRAASLTRQLLAFSRKQILHPQPLIIDTTIHNMRHMFARLLGEDVQLKMSLNVPDAAIFADPGQFDQILMNLVVNARDAMPAGGALTMETSEPGSHEVAQTRDFSGSWVVISVTDTGMGMDEATQSHLFEPYFTTKETGKGSGLGLSTIHGIVAQSGGDIQVESTPGAGTTFRIYLPKMVGPISFPKSVEATPKLFGTETILVVEDEAEVRAYTVAALKAYGYRTFAAEDAQAALLVAERESGPIDLVLTDMVMPKMNGLELAARLAQLKPSLRVLYMSGYSSDMMASRGVLQEGLLLVEKPFSPEQLVQKVREVLGPPKLLSSVLVLAGDEVRNQIGLLLSREGYEVVEPSERTHPAELVITELEEETQAVGAVQRLRQEMPDAAIIVILQASGGRFLELERLVAADGAIARPISTGFLLKTVKEVLGKNKSNPGG
jgi:PAS domain S-box-containing protein